MNALASQREDRARSVQWLVFAALVAIAMGFAMLTEGTWHWNGTPTRLLLALLGLGAFAVLFGLRPRARLGSDTDAAEARPDDDTQAQPTPALPVFYASQTGTAEMYARQTADALTRAGQPSRAVALETLDRAGLEGLARALFIVSTTDEGDPPYPVVNFARDVLESGAALGHLRYGLLALGDSYYDSFCGFGRRLDAWLGAQGASPLFARIDVDDNDPAALAAWQAQVGKLAEGVVSDTLLEGTYHSWRISERRELNPGSQGEPVFRITLVPTEGVLPDWRAGDIARVQPRHAPDTIAEWLQRAGLDPDAPVETHAGSETLARYLARCELPDPALVRGQAIDPIARALLPLRGRDYSIASLPKHGRIELLIRQGRDRDGRISLGADWLTRRATTDDSIAVMLRRNPNFHLDDSAAPLILIGNGTGIAGLLALLRERIAHGRLRNWLLFGERQREHDFHCREELEALLEHGQLAHLDLAFSRDATPRTYVQHLLARHDERLRDWLDAGATLCVCGSRAGMAEGIDATLRGILGAAQVQHLIETGRYRRDVY